MGVEVRRGATGRCLCRAVVFTIDGPRRDVFECHCERCRRFTGHHVAATATAPGALTIEGDAVRWYSPHETVEYGFCGRCGSSLFWRSTAPGGDVSVMAGALDQPTGLRTTEVWWASERADYVDAVPGRIEHEMDG